MELKEGENKISEELTMVLRDKVAEVRTRITKDKFYDDCPITEDDAIAYLAYKNNLAKEVFKEVNKVFVDNKDKIDILKTSVGIHYPINNGNKQEYIVQTSNAKARVRNPRTKEVVDGVTSRVYNKLPKGAFADICKDLINEFN